MTTMTTMMIVLLIKVEMGLSQQKCLAYKHENLSQVSRTHVRHPGTVDPCDWLTSQVSLLGELQASERLSLEKIKIK